jgi:hypothetical protein
MDELGNDEGDGHPPGGDRVGRGHYLSSSSVKAVEVSINEAST